MIIILKKEAAESQVNGLLALLQSKNIQPHVSRGSLQTIVGCVGDVSHLDPGILEALDGVESVRLDVCYDEFHDAHHIAKTVPKGLIALMVRRILHSPRSTQ